MVNFPLFGTAGGILIAGLVCLFIANSVDNFLTFPFFIMGIILIIGAAFTFYKGITD